MNRYSKLLALGVGSALAASLSVSAVPVLVTSTIFGGHEYFLYADAGVAWPDALIAAGTLIPGGYLAALTTAPETSAVWAGLIGNGFFTATPGAAQQAWLGGFSTPSTQTNPANFGWTSGEMWTAFNAGNFGPGQPSGDLFGDLTINFFGDSTFNDQTNYPAEVGGFIVESDVVIPDAGSTLSLLGLALTGMTVFSRRSK